MRTKSIISITTMYSHGIYSQSLKKSSLHYFFQPEAHIVDIFILLTAHQSRFHKNQNVVTEHFIDVYSKHFSSLWEYFNHFKALCSNISFCKYNILTFTAELCNRDRGKVKKRIIAVLFMNIFFIFYGAY